MTVGKDVRFVMSIIFLTITTLLEAISYHIRYIRVSVNSL